MLSQHLAAWKRAERRRLSIHSIRIESQRFANEELSRRFVFCWVAQKIFIQIIVKINLATFFKLLIGHAKGEGNRYCVYSSLWKFLGCNGGKWSGRLRFITPAAIFQALLMKCESIIFKTNSVNSYYFWHIHNFGIFYFIFDLIYRKFLHYPNNWIITVLSFLFLKHRLMMCFFKHGKFVQLIDDFQFRMQFS